MYQYKATIKRVIDGDTAVVDIDLGFFMWLHDLHIRFYGINAPERNTDGAAAATDFVKNFFVENPVAIINVYGQDKYGRWLGEFLDPASGTTLNHQLASLGLATVYFP